MWILQGEIQAAITNETLMLETNGDRSAVQYNVTDGPLNGQLSIDFLPVTRSHGFSMIHPHAGDSPCVRRVICRCICSDVVCLRSKRKTTGAINTNSVYTHVLHGRTSLIKVSWSYVYKNRHGCTVTTRECPMLLQPACMGLHVV